MEEIQLAEGALQDSKVALKKAQEQVGYWHFIHINEAQCALNFGAQVRERLGRSFGVVAFLRCTDSRS